MILPYDANLRRMEFSERTATLEGTPSEEIFEGASEEEAMSWINTRTSTSDTFLNVW
jgi:hypothetical protein